MSGCPNCGGSNSIDLTKKGAYCELCGFKTESSYEVKVEMQEIDIVYCEGCGTSYSSPPGCTTHSKDKQKVRKFGK
jgi:ribosome-binding protein aMBF1 (putative translation factor)